jgi:hypothetical protein
MDPDPGIHATVMDPDLDPDPAIFVNDFEDANKKIKIKSFSAYFFLKVRIRTSD